MVFEKAIKNGFCKVLWILEGLGEISNWELFKYQVA